MMGKSSSAVKRMLRKKWEDACNGYLVELLNNWGLDASYGYWIANEIGGTYAYGDYLFINMDDIVYCVENDVPQEKYIEYTDYCLWAHEFGFTVPNFESYFKGCPIAPKDVQERLTKQKRDFEKLIREEQEKLKNNAKANPF